MWSQSCPFSIVVCTYNGARFIDEQLHSLRRQEGVREIIVSDDGSTDQTLSLVARHAADDPRIRLHRNPSQKGITANFEHAISLATSPWIALADQDDVWLPGKLARMRACWDGDACLVHHASRKFRGVSPPRLPSIRASETRKFEGQDWRRLLHRNSVVGHTVLISASTARQLRPFPATLPHDWWLGVGAAIQGSVQFIDEYLVHYRIHAHNAYHSMGSRYRRMRDEYELRLDMLEAITTRSFALRAGDREFTQRYHQLLLASDPGTFSWPLWRFYLKHAPVFFSSPLFQLSAFTAFRKSLTATLAAFVQRPAVHGARTRKMPA